MSRCADTVGGRGVLNVMEILLRQPITAAVSVDVPTMVGTHSACGLAVSAFAIIRASARSSRMWTTMFQNVILVRGHRCSDVDVLEGNTMMPFPEKCWGLFQHHRGISRYERDAYLMAI
jgi:hypothetical protein